MRQNVTHNCCELVYKNYILLCRRWCIKFYFCIILAFGNFSCRNISITDTSFRIHESLIYIVFLMKTGSSGIELIIKSDGRILCMSLIFTFQSLPVGPDTSNYLRLISLIILKFSIYLASQFKFLSKFLIMTKSTILYCGKSSYLSYSV